MSRILLLKITVSLMLALSVASLYMGYRLFEQREILKGRTQTLEESVKRIAQTIETGDETGETITISDTQLSTYELMNAPLNNLEASARYQLERLNMTRKELSDTQSVLTKTHQDLLTITANLEDKTEQYNNAVAVITARDATIREKDVSIGNLEREKTDLERKVATLELNIEELQVEKRDLTDKISEQSAKIEELEDQLEPTRITERLEKGWHGVITHVEPDWSFVIFDIAPGSLGSIIPEVELLVHRGEQFLGKVRVSNVENNLAVADVISDWQQAPIQKNDELIH